MNVRGKSLLERLAAVKSSHGGYRKAQDALIEITRLRQELDESLLRRARDEALAERTSLLDRISSQNRLIADLKSQLSSFNSKAA